MLIDAKELVAQELLKYDIFSNIEFPNFEIKVLINYTYVLKQISKFVFSEKIFLLLLKLSNTINVTIKRNCLSGIKDCFLHFDQTQFEHYYKFFPISVMKDYLVNKDFKEIILQILTDITFKELDIHILISDIKCGDLIQMFCNELYSESSKIILISLKLLGNLAFYFADYIREKINMSKLSELFLESGISLRKEIVNLISLILANCDDKSYIELCQNEKLLSFFSESLDEDDQEMNKISLMGIDNFLKKSYLIIKEELYKEIAFLNLDEKLLQLCEHKDEEISEKAQKLCEYLYNNDKMKD